MYKSTTTPQKELLSTQSNAEDNHNKDSSELIEKHEIMNTPFCVIGNEERGYFGAMGKFRMTDIFPTREAVEAHMDVKVWDMILKVVAIVTEDILEQHDKAKEKANK